MIDSVNFSNNIIVSWRLWKHFWPILKYSPSWLWTNTNNVTFWRDLLIFQPVSFSLYWHPFRCTVTRDKISFMQLWAAVVLESSVRLRTVSDRRGIRSRTSNRLTCSNHSCTVALVQPVGSFWICRYNPHQHLKYIRIISSRLSEFFVFCGVFCICLISYDLSVFMENIIFCGIFFQNVFNVLNNINVQMSRNILCFFCNAKRNKFKSPNIRHTKYMSKQILYFSLCFVRHTKQVNVLSKVLLTEE